MCEKWKTIQYHCTIATTTKTTKTMILQESSVDLMGQIRGAVKNDSSFTVSVTRKITSSTDKVVLFQETWMPPLLLDILRLRWELEMQVKNSGFCFLPLLALNVMYM